MGETIQNPELRVVNNYFRGSIRKGDIVKVSNGKERFWCIVFSSHSDEYTCKIDSDLFDSNYSKGDYIWVKRENVFQTISSGFHKLIYKNVHKIIGD